MGEEHRYEMFGFRIKCNCSFHGFSLSYRFQFYFYIVGLSQSQLLVPLSFASILGGTCTLIGTSTNLVVSGLLQDRYPNDPSMYIGLFDLGEFGIPVLFIGITYILLASPYLLPGGEKGRKDETIPLDDGSILLGARLTKWSPAAGRSVKRSGLRDTGGIYLVSVYRASTGNVHRAVGQEFILNVDDILYFTGMIEEFGQFCDHHGLEVVTNESDVATNRQVTVADESTNDLNNVVDEVDLGREHKKVKFASIVQTTINEAPGIHDDETLPLTIETTTMSPKSSLFSIEAEKMRALNRMRGEQNGFLFITCFEFTNKRSHRNNFFLPKTIRHDSRIRSLRTYRR